MESWCNFPSLIFGMSRQFEDWTLAQEKALKEVGGPLPSEMWWTIFLGSFSAFQLVGGKSHIFWEFVTYRKLGFHDPIWLIFSGGLVQQPTSFSLNLKSLTIDFSPSLISWNLDVNKTEVKWNLLHCQLGEDFKVGVVPMGKALPVSWKRLPPSFE